MWRRLKAAFIAGEPPHTHGGVIGQVWRSGTGRQAQLARALQAIEVASLDLELGRRAGNLLARAGASDVIDAGVVVLAANGDLILTSDPDDLSRLVAAAGVLADVVTV